MVVGDQRTVPAALPPRRTRYLGGPQGRSGQVRKISPPLTYHVRSPNRPARSEWLYRLLYPSPHLWYSYLLTPWCRFLLEKLTGLQLVEKFPAFYGTRRFISLFTRARKVEDNLLKLPVLMKIWSCSCSLHYMWRNLLFHRKLLCPLNHSDIKTNCKTRRTQSTLIHITCFHWCLYE